MAAFLLWYSFHSLLAGGAASAGSLSFCLANYAATSNSRNRPAWSVWAAVRDAFASGKVIARASTDLKWY